MTNPQRKPASIAEYLFNELRHAVRDIRQKLVEEGWFGRVVTPTPVDGLDPWLRTADTEPSRPSDRHSQTFEELWAPRERSPEAAEREPAPEVDFDR